MKWEKYQLSEYMHLWLFPSDKAGFTEMRLVNEDGEFMPITMHEILNAVSAAYYYEKKTK